MLIIEKNNILVLGKDFIQGIMAQLFIQKDLYIHQPIL